MRSILSLTLETYNVVLPVRKAPPFKFESQLANFTHLFLKLIFFPHTQKTFPKNVFQKRNAVTTQLHI